jgi:hypothetical protein
MALRHDVDHHSHLDSADGAQLEVPVLCSLDCHNPDNPKQFVSVTAVQVPTAARPSLAEARQAWDRRTIGDRVVLHPNARRRATFATWQEGIAEVRLLARGVTAAELEQFIAGLDIQRAND